jgi:transposase
MLATSDLDYKVLYEQSQLELINLKHQLEQLKKMIFGSKNERFIPTDKNNPQLALDITAETVAACSLVNAQKITFTR